MKKTYLLLLLSIFMFSACSSDDDNGDTPDGMIEITSTIKCAGDKDYIADVGARMYLFVNFTNVDAYDYKEGKFTHKTNNGVVNHSRRELANGDGKATIKIDKSKQSTIVIESARYAGQYEIKVVDLDKSINLGEFKFEKPQ